MTYMMSDSEIGEAIEDLKTMTIADEIGWTRTTDGHSFASSDLDGFKVELSIDSAGDVALRIDDDEGPVALVSVGDNKTSAEGASLLGATYALLSLARSHAGSEAKSKWKGSVTKRKTESRD